MAIIKLHRLKKSRPLIDTNGFVVGLYQGEVRLKSSAEVDEMKFLYFHHYLLHFSGGGEDVGS